MNTQSLGTAVSRSTYPGRGIVMGFNEDGRHAVIAYFIMGRSENSRNRIFVEDVDGVRTQAHDPAKMKDPSLVIYAPVRVLGNTTIVTNGDQTDTVYECLAGGGSFYEALRTRTFEPDPPNYTPRISGMMVCAGEGMHYRLSILKSADGDPGSVRRCFYEYENPMWGVGHFIHTYMQDGDPLPSFDGEPEQVALGGGIDDIADTLWRHLDGENKVAVFVRFIDVETGETNTRIVNRHHG